VVVVVVVVVVVACYYLFFSHSSSCISTCYSISCQLISKRKKRDDSSMKMINSSNDLLQSRPQAIQLPNEQLSRRASLSNASLIRKRPTPISNSQARSNVSSRSTNAVPKRAMSSSNVQSVIDVIEGFFQASDTMENEVLLPTLLKDMSVEGLLTGSSRQFDVYSWN
jgi:hypothetical protein